MAAKALEQVGEKLNISIKVETNGQEGVKNQLTQDDIDHCTCIIVAADKKVEMQRFEAKKVIQVPVRDGISKAEELVQKANNGDGEIYHHDTKKEKQNIIRLFYKHLMNGISHALPFLVASGVLYGILYLVKDQVLSNQSLTLINYVQQLITIMIIPIVSAYIADSIADRPAMVSGFAGGLIVCQGISMSSISANSTSLLAGIVAGFLGMLISYDYYPMAAVMAGGMIPPFVIALTATLSKNRFSNRKDALMNYINGISFISEGAIPFIQQESTVILPACCLAAGIAGALSMYFECSITSPHGGLFLIWMVNNPLYYLALIVLSTVVGTLLLFIFTKLKNNVK